MLSTEDIGERLWPHIGHELTVKSDGTEDGVTALVCVTCEGRGGPVIVGSPPPPDRR